MTTITMLTVPCEDFALSTTASAVPDVRARCEAVVETGANTVIPLIWIRTSNFEAFDDALEGDPTVTDATVLTDQDDRRLYRMEWTRPVHLLLEMIVNGEGILLDASLDDDHWTLRLLHATRETAHQMVEFCESHEFSLTVRSIREMDSAPPTRYGLSEAQYQALQVAHRRDYFSVPRALTLQDLADELGISHQAASERLRRGFDRIIRETIASDPFPPVDSTESSDDSEVASPSELS